MSKADVALRDATHYQTKLTEAYGEAEELREQRDEAIITAMLYGKTRYQIAKATGMAESTLTRFVPRMARRMIPETARELPTFEKFIEHAVEYPLIDCAVVLKDRAMIYRAKAEHLTPLPTGGSSVDTVAMIVVVKEFEALGQALMAVGDKTEDTIRQAAERALAGEMEY